MSNYWSSQHEEWGFQGPFETEEDAVEECIGGYGIEDDDDSIYVGKGNRPDINITKSMSESILEDWVERQQDIYEDFWDDFFGDVAKKDPNYEKLTEMLNKTLSEWVSERGIDIPWIITDAKCINYGDWRKEHPDE